MALFGIVFLGGTPIGAPIAGWVGEHFGPRMGVALGGVVAIATGLAGIYTLMRRRLRDPSSAAAASATAAPVAPDEPAVRSAV
jgi:predicted MFS family arabinose efflux permease